MSKLEQYGHNFQIKVLSTLVKDREFLQQVADIVSPDFLIMKLISGLYPKP